jgi:hypothetical protein
MKNEIEDVNCKGYGFPCDNSKDDDKSFCDDCLEGQEADRLLTILITNLQ